MLWRVSIIIYCISIDFYSKVYILSIYLYIHVSLLGFKPTTCQEVHSDCSFPVTTLWCHRRRSAAHAQFVTPVLYNKPLPQVSMVTAHEFIGPDCFFSNLLMFLLSCFSLLFLSVFGEINKVPDLSGVPITYWLVLLKQVTYLNSRCRCWS